jgi:hypothetical protein
MAAVLKTAVTGDRHRGFESHALRHADELSRRTSSRDDRGAARTARSVTDVRMAGQRPRVQWRKDSIPAALIQVTWITFIVLKLTDVITWSWVWVLSPLWMGGILLVLGVCALLIAVRRHARQRTRWWLDQLGAQWFADFMAGKAGPDAPGNDFGVDRGEGRAPRGSGGLSGMLSAPPACPFPSDRRGDAGKAVGCERSRIIIHTRHHVGISPEEAERACRGRLWSSSSG